MADTPSGAPSAAATTPSSAATSPGAADSKTAGEKSGDKSPESAAGPGAAGTDKGGEKKGGDKPGDKGGEEHTIKVNGVEKKVTLSELIRLAQLNDNAELTTKQARDLEKKARAVLEKFKTREGVAEVLKEHHGKDVVDFAVEILSEEQKKMQAEADRKAADDRMDPRDKEIAALKKRLDDLDREKADNKKKDDDEQKERTIQTLNKSIIDTLEMFPENFRQKDAAGKLIPFEFVANRVVDTWTWCIENQDELAKKNIKPTPQLVRDVVMKNMRHLAKLTIASAKDEELDELTDPGARERLVKKYSAAAQAAVHDAHPGLTSDPKVREGDKKEEEVRPRRTTAELIRGLPAGG